MKYDLTTQASDFLKLANKYLEEGAKVELKKLHPKRSLRQNNYYHVCVGIFAKETGYTVKELKRVIYDEIELMNYVKANPLTGELTTYHKSSADLSSLQMIELIDFVRKLASEQGIYIPTSDEYLQNQIEIDNYLQYAI